MASFFSELGLTWTEAGLVVITAVTIYATTVAATRLFGQRQFATLSSFDMVFVFALSAVIGRVILVRTSLTAAVLGLLVMFLTHSMLGWLHHNLVPMHRLMQNSPVLLVADGRMLTSQLEDVHMSRLELQQGLRQQGHASLENLRAVILEPSGNLSVIAADSPLAPEFLDDVDGADRLR